MKIIDFHTHIYPENIAEKATQSVCDFYDLESKTHSATSQNLIKIGKRAKIDKFVILPVAIKAEHVGHINDFTASQAKSHKEFIGFGTLHADMENPIDECERIIKLGLHGIKLHPDTQCFSIDDERMFPIYDALQGKLPVLFHCGDPRYDFSHPKRLKRILKLFPNLTVIAAHLGGWSIFYEAFELLKDENCFFDLSSSIMFLKPEELYRIINGYSADRILFGSDFPLWDPESEVKTFLNLNLTNEQKEKIAYKNAEKILKIKF